MNQTFTNPPQNRRRTMGIVEEDQELGRPKGDLELVDCTSSSSNTSAEASGRIEEVDSGDHADGVWSDHATNRHREAYYTWGDRIRFGFLFVLMITLVVTISAKVGIRNKNEENTPVSVVEPITTASPTVTPLPTPVPTTSPAPTVDPLRAQRIVEYINDMTFFPRELVYPSEASTEEKALKWIIDDDPLQRQLPNDAISIRERYVLACLWFQSEVPFTDNSYEGFYSEYNYTSSWMTYHYECEWTGITCSEIEDDEGYGTKLITGILLYNSSVYGVLSPDIALLPALVNLRLHVNSISSPVPQTLATLPLKVLDLGNDFYGSIPTAYENLVNITNILLYDNRMDGQIPDFSQSKNLEQLLLYSNAFTGTLPESYFHMEYLDSFDVSGNPSLGGEIAPTNSTDGSFSPFQKLIMHSTNLTGSLEDFCQTVGPDDGTKEFSVDIEQVDCSCCHFFCPWTNATNATEWAPIVACEEE